VLWCGGVRDVKDKDGGNENGKKGVSEEFLDQF
jgi:hypothetical protein